MRRGPGKASRLGRASGAQLPPCIWHCAAGMQGVVGLADI